MGIQAAPRRRMGNVQAIVSVGLASGPTILAKALQDFGMAYLIGVTGAVDALGIAISLGSFVLTILIGPAVVALLPNYIILLERDGRHRATRLLGEFLPIMGAIAAFLMVLFQALASPLIRLISHGSFPDQTADLGADLLRIYMLLVPLRAATQVTSAILSAERRFFLPVLTSVIPPLTAISLLYGTAQELGVYAIVIGLVAGEALQLAVISTIAIRLIGMPVPLWSGFSDELRQISRQYLPIFAGSGIASLSPLINQGIASGLGAGSIARLVYGQKLVGVVLQVGSLAISTVLLPYFSRLAALDDWTMLRRASIRYSGLTIAASLPIAAIFLFFSDDMVWLVLRHGAFTARDTQEVASVMQCLAFQIPFYSAGIIVARVVAAVQATYILALGALVSIVANIIFAQLLATYWGLSGIALSTSIVYFIWFGFLATAVLILVRRQAPA